MTKGVRVTSIDGIEAVPLFKGALRWHPVRHELDVRAFGVNAYTAPRAGDMVIEDHTEDGGGAGRHEELYVVLSGRAVFTLDGEETDAPAGTLVFVHDPKVRRGARAAADATTVLVVGGRPGEPYEVSPWEHWMRAIPLAEAGDPARAADMVAEGLADYPDHPGMLYNLACMEALAGRGDSAVAHLRRAFELEPKARKWADGDEDLASIRDRPDFPA